ncbi:acyltransferase family protein [Jannaschia seohaensis]|uniref:Peptidoglycan/LPS O-acetylase OafA/YrhL n=1 Tax=Jannaschia seohaensis TaxID=475081 RepID=A0A2Y9A4R2_9RHOB|nr:acyltransferase [Jannaschia seohaensis]PWJ22170.1 peptidoglycan/LPS O-acetylase OafA/YrhL [Jannaschia seohaensis]SSA38448.1 Peptidoglycan/LPS O-acetylase OafA/YrhL, contains acyltransferase and SGNH-hydrolase domains [Jannaschia seohaensis]
MSAQTDRLDAVDGVRTLAILWVALYHYAVFWTPAGRGDDLVPYGEALAWIPFADLGHLGVSMFFVVSGFVIAFSLERSASALDFAARRLLRLWPTLLICGTLTFVATSLLGPAELVRGPVEYAVSLLFLPPEHVGRALGLPGLEWLDGAYWSLWVEVRFYGVAALLFWLARRRFLLAWTAFVLVCAVIQARLGADHALSGLLFTEFQPFFTLGIALAAMRSQGIEPGPLALFLLGAMQALIYAPEDSAHLGALLALIALTTLACLTRRPLPVLSARPVTRIGRASYAYYLLHQNLGLAVLAALSTLGALGTGLGIAAMLAVQAGIVLLSIFLTERVEQPLGRRLRAALPRASAPA